MTFKKTILTLHLWLGLTSGLVVFVVSLSGAVFTFQDEVRDAVEPYRQVAATGPLLRPSRLQATALRNHPGTTASYLMYPGPGRATVVYMADKAGGSFVAYVNPYTGRELHYQNLRRDFFTIVQHLHMYLLLPPAVGEWIVGPAVLIFVVMLVTGLILWWPKRKTDRRRSFTIKWGARWRRVNYDLHNVLGFYAAGVALLIALTGLMMSYEWVRDSATFVSNGGQSYPAETTPPAIDSLPVAAAAPRPVIDLYYEQMRRLSPGYDMLFLAAPTSVKEPAYGIAYQRALRFYHRDDYYFHPVSGRLLVRRPHGSKSTGAKLVDMNYDLHTGLLLGLGGKIVAFLGSLISASLPVSGFLVWWGKRNKQKKPRQSAALAGA
ncbi:PepSY-associated TM helix domain-containing protein [Hymenobacter algoricola]|uniref:PepSY-associated TM helix domain-containing protein n=1 Tax=Hymenobacter algoricola TaxID=486267 RepID=A0ABP7NX10_9BACT